MVSAFITSSPGRLSTRVRMHLELDGEVLPVNQLGPDFVWLEAARALPATAGRLVVSVDGELTTRLVRLPEGVSAGLTRAAISEV